MNPYKKSLIYLQSRDISLRTFRCFWKTSGPASLDHHVGARFLLFVGAAAHSAGRAQAIRLEGKKDFFCLAALGVLLAVHWASFYEAIQLSTVALGLLSFSTFPVFVTFLEPLFFRQKLRLENVIIALVVFAGIAVVVPEFKLENPGHQGHFAGHFLWLHLCHFGALQQALHWEIFGHAN